MSECFPKLLNMNANVRRSNDDRSLVAVHGHGAEMRSRRGADAGKVVETAYFVAAKNYLPIKANSRVAYEKNRLI